MVKYPCQGCIYSTVCGSTTRREPCTGRVTKSQQKQIKRDIVAEEVMQEEDRARERKMQSMWL